MRLGIVGYSECGKDLICDTLRDKHGLRFTGGTSWHALRIVWDSWGKHHYETAHQCYNDRRNHKDMWHTIIVAYNHGDPCRLYRRIMEESDILQGVRDDRELAGIKEAGLVDAWVWVHRDVPKDTTKFSAEDCDYVLDNTGTIDDLIKNVNRLVESIKSSNQKR